MTLDRIDANPKPMGRPSTYSADVAAAICARLSKGETLRSICRDPDMPEDSTVRTWALDDREGFYAHYTKARDLGLDAMADDLFDIADETGKDTLTDKDGNDRPNSEWITRSRLRVDTRKWYLSKLAPKRYGDRIEIESDALTSIAGALAEARKRTEGEP